MEKKNSINNDASQRWKRSYDEWGAFRGVASFNTERNVWKGKVFTFYEKVLYESESSSGLILKLKEVVDAYVQDKNKLIFNPLFKCNVCGITFTMGGTYCIHCKFGLLEKMI